MAIQGAINRLIGTAGAAVTLADKMSKDSSKGPEPKASGSDAGIDAKMAAKARRVAQQKIKTIQANKELSEKAKTRRIGKVLDEYMGGNK